jgi:Delta7-sterol 5-desaturase
MLDLIQSHSFYFSFDLNSFEGFLKIFSFSFFAILIRYVLVSGLFYYLFWIKKNNSNRLQKKDLKPNQIRYEFFWSSVATLIFSFVSYILLWLWQNDYTQFYLKLDDFSYFYLPLSFFLLLFFHEIYFYVTHLFMHKPSLYKRMHQIHHYSSTVSPWASFSFHPYETLVHALFIPLFVMVVPVHPVIIFVYLIFMTVTAVSNHLGYEIIKSKNIRSWFISGEHHSLHHEKFKYNFGLYFTLLDKIFKTEYAQPEKRNIE